ncbi:MAG: B12-binding domain-containing radical SAM protein [Desulfobacteraceae bacterium]|nr:B12-binding domain-containing radical SAM protein [Desulfobacteraceae bacterium]
MPDILLIQPPIRDFYLTAKRTIPYGLASIASSLIQAGFSVEILDALATSKSREIQRPAEMACLDEYYGKPDVSPFALFHRFRHYGYGFERLGAAAARSGAFLVGISSLFTAYADEALRTAEAVKAHHPECTVVLGGHHPTEMPERVMECAAVDYVLRGEGEVSLPALASALRNGSPVDQVPGIVTRAPGGTLRMAEPAVLERLDDTPPPAVHLVDNRFYSRKGRGGAVVVASRGCPMKCSYCSVGASSRAGYRRRSVEAVLGEIESAVRERGCGFIDFEDENIALEKQWFRELLTGIREKCAGTDVELRAMNGLFPPSLTEEAIRAMRDAGFRTLNLSLGSTSAEQLKRFRRPDVRETFERALHWAERYGLEVVGYIIVGAPGQNPGDSLQDLLYLAGRKVIAGVSVYYPSPGSADFEKCREAGILPSRTSLMRSTALPISHTTTREESATLLRLGRLLNFMKSAAASNASPTEGAPDPRDRAAVGRFLLEAFFRDGIIRGMTPDGEIYAHRTSRKLCEGFIQGMKDLRLWPVV